MTRSLAFETESAYWIKELRQDFDKPEYKAIQHKLHMSQTLDAYEMYMYRHYILNITVHAELLADTVQYELDNRKKKKNFIQKLFKK